MSSSQRQAEKWLLQRIKTIGNTPDAGFRAHEKHAELIDAYKYLISIRPKEMQGDPFVTDFFSHRFMLD